MSQPPNILTCTAGHINYTHTPRAQQMSPCCSDFSDAQLSDPEPDLSDDDDDSRPGSPSPLSTQQTGMDGEYVTPTRVTKANFVIEELSDFDEDDMEGRTDIIHPTAIEYAETERRADKTLDRRILNDLRNLHCRSPDPGFSSEDSDLDEAAHAAILQRVRERERRHRMSKSSIGTKRTMSDRGGSDYSSDQEGGGVRGGVRGGYLGFEEAGSSARRLRKRLAGDRRGLIFQDPPARIDEVVEPEELEEALARELPFYEYTSMEVDSPRSPYD